MGVGVEGRELGDGGRQMEREGGNVGGGGGGLQEIDSRCRRSAQTASGRRCRQC